MARYRGPTCRLSRREGTDLFLKSGLRTLESKCRSDKDGLSPLGIPAQRRGRISDYGLQLREKQKVRRLYGVLERQFRGYYKRAAHMSGATGLNLLQLLESRLDNIAYRIGWGCTRADARQLVAHRSIEVNGRMTNIPSYCVMPGDKIRVRTKAQGQQRIQDALEIAKVRVQQPDWLEISTNHMGAVFTSLPPREKLSDEINEHLIVELYSK